MKSNSKLYVAGHNGLVGSAILEALQKQGYKNIVTRDRKALDLRDAKAVDDFFAQEKPEYVFLAAAKVGGIWANEHYPAEFIHDNMAIALNVIHAAHVHNVAKLVNLGSSCIYPKYAEQPIKEKSLLTGSLEPTNEPYAIAKIAAITLCRSYHKQYGSNFISLMPTNLYGINDNFHFENSHVIPALIRKFVLAKFLAEKDYDALKTNLRTQVPKHWQCDSPESIEKTLSEIGVTSQSVKIWGTGNVYREFLHAEDCAEAVLHCMLYVNADQADPCINIGTGMDCTIKEIAQLIAEIVGFEGTLILDSTKPDGTPRKLLNVDAIHSLGWHHRISLENGLRDVIHHYSTVSKQ